MTKTMHPRGPRHGRLTAGSLLARLALSAMVSLSACATHVDPIPTENPPPTEPLANFDHFQMLPIDGTVDAKSQKAAFAHIDHNLQVNINDLTRPWEKPTAGGRKLDIAPYVQDLKFVGGGERFLVGAMAGSSVVIVKLRLTDADTKTVIAEPQFFEKGSAYSGAWTMGATDNGMLGRIAQAAAGFMRDNHDRAIGGPTGYIPE